MAKIAKAVSQQYKYCSTGQFNGATATGTRTRWIYYGVNSAIQTIFGQRNSETQLLSTLPEHSNLSDLTNTKGDRIDLGKRRGHLCLQSTTSNWLAVNVTHQQNGHCGPKQINYGAMWTASCINPLEIDFARLPSGKYSSLCIKARHISEYPPRHQDQIWDTLESQSRIGWKGAISGLLSKQWTLLAFNDMHAGRNRLLDTRYICRPF